MTPIKSQKNKHVAVGYLRVSSDDQIQGISLDYQEEQCRAAAKQDGYAEVLIIKDEGKTGKNLKRKGIQEVIELAKKREISIVYVTNSDRLARNIGCHTFLRHTFSSNGVELKYLNGQSSGEDAGSIMADNMFATVAQYHSDITREKSQQATDKKARAGYFPTHAPIGYLNIENPDKLCEKVAKRIIVPNPKTGQLVTESFKLYATGQYNTYQLNDVMHKKGLVSNVGKKLAESVFVNLLKNRLYLGEIHWQGIFVKEGKHEPLIDEDTFNRVQSITVKHVGGRCRRRKYFWLLNGYVFCPIHNRRYTAEFHLNKSKAYYHCPHREGCGKYVERSDLEKQVSDKFKSLQFESSFIDSVISRVKEIFQARKNEYHAAHRGLLNRKNACEAKLGVVEDRLIDQTLSKDDYTRIKDEIRAAVAIVDGQISSLEKTKEINIDVACEILNFTKDIYNVYMRADEQLQKKFIGFFFERFEVQNGLIIKYCYTPLFEELVRLKAVVYKTQESQKPIDNNVDSSIIITPKLGAYPVMLRVRELHKL